MINENNFMISSEENGETISRFVLNALSTCDDLQSFLARVYDKYKMSIIITDMAFRYIAYAGLNPCPDPLWQKIIDSGAAEPETVINEYFGNGFTDTMMATDGAIDATWGVNADYPQSTCAIKINKFAAGCCSVLYLDRDKLDFALNLNAALADAAAVYLNGMKAKLTTPNQYERAAIAKFMLENPSTPVSLLYGTHFYQKEKFDKYCMVAVISAITPNAAKLQNIATWIREDHPQMLYINKGDDICMFFWNIRSASHRREILDCIQKEATGKLDIICGASDLFSDPDMRQAPIEQANLSLDYGRKFGSEKLYSFYDCYIDIIVRRGYSNISEQNLIVPEIKTLIKYDEDNKTNFFETLDIFLDEYCDITNAANRLFIHRNSMLYRIKKCEDIMNVDLKNNDVRRKLSLCSIIMKMRKNDANNAI